MLSLKEFGVVGLDMYTWGIKDFHKCWSGSLAKRRLCLGPAGVINCTPLPANMKGPGIEKQNHSRRVRRLTPSRRFKPQSLGVASNETFLLKVRSFPANAPNVAATRSGKQTHSEEQCR